MTLAGVGGFLPPWPLVGILVCFTYLVYSVTKRKKIKDEKEGGKERRKDPPPHTHLHTRGFHFLWVSAVLEGLLVFVHLPLVPHSWQ